MSAVQIIDCEQRSPEWYAARAGIPTASEFATVMAKGKDGGDSKTRKTYMLKLAGEILTGEPAESYDNAYMERGRQQEDEARDLYAFMAGEEPCRVGFIRNGQKGCSPDSLIGERGMVEIKTALPHIHIEHMLKGEFPAVHKAQCQGGLWVAEREWIDIAIFCPRLPLFIKRAHRDEAYIARLSAAVDEFNAELAETVERIRHYGDPNGFLKSRLGESIGAAA